MAAYKDEERGTWYVSFHYTDWRGKNKRKMKRGFSSRKDALEWERHFLARQSEDMDMEFGDFLEIYYSDQSIRLRKSTMSTKKYVVDLKILPFFKGKKMSEITVPDIRKWQNEILSQGYSDTYVKTINNQLSAIFNYAVRYYGLRRNPCKTAGSIGKARADEMCFWTKQEFSSFVECLMDKQESYTAFMVLYWTGMRVGEMLALYPEVIDINNREITICRSYQTVRGESIISEPKTQKSKRTITIPEFLAADLQDYMNTLYGLEEGVRIFPFTKSFIEHEMLRGIQLSGVKKIRVHDIRHSHASLLVEMGFSPLEIAKRLGHEKVETTLNTYAHLYPDSQTKLAEKLNEKYKEEL